MADKQQDRVGEETENVGKVSDEELEEEGYPERQGESQSETDTERRGF